MQTAQTTRKVLLRKRKQHGKRFGSHPHFKRTHAVSRSYLSSVAQVCSASPSPSGLDPTKLTVTLSSGAGDIYSTPRRYTLTHSDLTGRLQLSVGVEYNKHQLSGWYLQLVRCAKLPVQAQSSGLPITASPPCVFYTGTRSWQSGA